MRSLLIPVGSAGDVHPYVGLGLALRRRGHDVTIATNPHFQPLIDRVGLKFIPLGTVAHYEAILANPDLWHPRKGLRVIGTAARAAADELFDIVRAHGNDRNSVVIGHSLAFAARTAQDALGLRLVTIHLSPSCLPSAYRTPILHSLLTGINCLPRVVKRPLLALGDLAADHMLDAAINPQRRSLGLSQVRHVTSRWWHSPTCVIGMFPDWFAPVQPDWPTQLCLTGFPLYDEQGAAATPPEVARFLDDGEPPVVFVAGSGNRQATQFFQIAVDVCRQLGRRGLLLTPHRAQLPATPPTGIGLFDYVPFTKLLPRAAALVHHGGIGSAAQALAAGIPHLVRPMTFDQPDNADRLRGLGVARVVPPARFRVKVVTRQLEHLLGSADVTERCRAMATRLRKVDALNKTCDIVEAVVRGDFPARGAAEPLGYTAKAGVE